MRKLFFSVVLVMLSLVAFGQQWVAINSDIPTTIKTTLLSSSEDNITVKLQVPGFYAHEVTTPRGEANIISVPRTVSTAQAGEPDLPMIAIPAVIGDRQHYSIRVINAQFSDFQMEVAPSKGDFPRTIDPAEVPYTYGDAYSTDAFFPQQNVGLYEPYILRDFRGQNMVVYPFAYNPVTHTLRVYHTMTVELFSDGISSENVIDRRSSVVKMDPEFASVYDNHFINYRENLSKYTPMVETGELLIICHDAFMNAMQPFVNWKKQIGRPTTMVGTSTTGATTAAIQSYIQNQYAANNNITHVLLVGDVAQIPGISYTAGSGWGSYSGKSDNMYGQVVGNDLYNDIIIGRFSAENETHVTTQVNKVIHYERDINTSDTWLVNGCGVAARAGNSGHFGEDDWQHIDNIRTDLLNYHYTTVYQEYSGTSGYSSTTQQISDRINSGVSIINYCNHGNETAWQSHSPYYSNSYVNALTNDNMLPIIWSVACLNGQYEYSQPCFAETWMRATNNSNGNPTGAIGGMFSYISQPWQPPMYGQDEMVDVLVESYSNNIKRTLGGCSYDGNMKILDQYGSNANDAKGTYLAWILFGDPTLTLRNDIPANMNVTHASSMSINATSFTVNATNGNGALATLTRNNEIMGSATITNGTCNITFDAPGTTGTATLTVFGYNKITYIATINIISGGTMEYTINVSASPEEGGSVSGGGTYEGGQNCTVTATPATGYDFTNWTENGNIVSSNASYTFMVTANRNLVANFTAIPQSFTIGVSADPTEGGTVTGGGTYQEGQDCTVIATPNANYTFTKWTENGVMVSTNARYTFSVTGDRNLVANFTYVPQNFTISVSANPTNGGSVSGGGTYQEGQSCTVTATPNANYTFTNWTENGTVVSNNANYTFTVSANRTLVANFSYVIPTYTISVSANPSNGGTVTGGGTFQQGQSCTVTATPNANYTFSNWTENGAVISSDASHTFIVNSNRNLVANFTYVPQEFNITVSANPNEGGSVSGGGTYQEGQSCTVTATPNAHYDFINWTENGHEVSANATYTFTANGNRNLVANFTYVPQEFTISVSANPTEGGTVTGGGTYQEGERCTVTATPSRGYLFTHWTENDEVVSTDESYSFTVTDNRTLIANFELQIIKITASVDPVEGASLTGDGFYTYGEEVTLTVISNEDYAFQNWTENDVVVSEDNTYTFIATENRDLVAHFLHTEGIGENLVSVTVYPNPTKGEVTLEGEGLSHVRIVNAYGQTVYNAEVEADQIRIDLSNMAKGIYMMHIEAEGGQTVRKIVVE